MRNATKGQRSLYVISLITCGYISRTYKSPKERPTVTTNIHAYGQTHIHANNQSDRLTDKYICRVRFAPPQKIVVASYNIDANHMMLYVDT